MFKNGDFSKLTKVSIRKLRYDDEVGLLKPTKIDNFTKYRYYSAKQIKRLNLIVSLRDMGFNIADIILALEADEKELSKLLKAKKKQVNDTIKLERDKINKINSTLNNLKMEKINMDYNVTIKKVPSYKVVSLRDTIPAYDQEGLLWQRLGEYIEKRNIKCSHISYATYHDEGFKERDNDVEVVMAIEEMLDDTEGFTFKETEPIEQAVSILVPGEFLNIAPAFNFLGKWIEENGYTICGTAREYPIKGPWNEENPADYLNELQIPVKK
jgi:DNA-binding transcriptional MerR regulator